MPPDAPRPIGPPARAVTTPAPDSRAVAKAFGLGEPSGAATFAARGELGRVWRLVTSTGTWAVKELLTPDSEEKARADAELALAAAAAQVPTPLPRLSTQNTVLAKVCAADSSWLIRVHTWVDLAPGPVGAPAAQAAFLLGRLHASAPADDRPIEPWFVEPVADDRWSELVGAAAAASAPWAALMAGRVTDLVATAELIVHGPRAPTVTCHRDFNPQNVLLGVDGHAVVVDWENCGPAVSDCEAAGAIAEFEVSDEDVQGFLLAYRAGGGPRIDLRPGTFAAVLAVQHHLVDHYATKSLDASLPAETRDRAAFWLDDILTHLFTVERVQRWVDAAVE